MKINRRVLIDSLAGLALGGGLVFIAYFSFDKQTALNFFPKEDGISKIIFFSSLILAPFFAIAVHEAGHLYAGLFQGFRTELFVVFFLGVRRNKGKIELFFNTNMQYFGGVAATSPKTPQNDSELIRKYAIIMISGPIASLMLAVVSFTILANYDLRINPFLGLLSVTSFGIFLATTLPDKSGIFFTDRKRFQRLIDKGETGKIELSFLQIVNQSLLENSFRNLSMDSINAIKKDKDRIIQFWGHYFEFGFYRDNEMIEEMNMSKVSLHQYKNVIPETFWKTLAID